MPRIGATESADLVAQVRAEMGLSRQLQQTRWSCRISGREDPLDTLSGSAMSSLQNGMLERQPKSLWHLSIAGKSAIPPTAK